MRFSSHEYGRRPTLKYIMIASFMLLATTTTTTTRVLATTRNPTSKQVVSKWEVAASMFGLQYKKQVPGGEPQDLMVIGANFGRTGTQSFVEAMRRLGLKCYHFKDGVYETPGHFEVWDDIILDDKNPEKFERLVQKISEDGFNATSDMPAFVFYKAFFDRYPQARVVVTVRPPSSRDGAPGGFAKSFVDSIVPIYQSAKEVPFRFFKIFQIFVRMQEWALLKYGVPLDPVTQLPDPNDLAAAHDAWIEKVKASIPSDKLLVYSYTDGWEPLCEFLSPIANSIEDKCTSIVASGEPYPYLNDGSTMRAVSKFLRGITFITKAIPVFFILYGATLIVRSRSKLKAD